MAEATPGASVISTDAAGAESAADKTEFALLIMVALSIALAPLNSTMIAVALPGIIAGFSASAAVAGWLVTGYLIAMASLQPVAGKLGDRVGRRTLMLGGLLYFGVVSLAAALSPSLPLLLFFRIQQGIAGALVFPNGTALLREVVPAARRAARFGIIGAVTGIAAALGPPLGGLLVGAFGWRSIFLMNVPLLLPALILGWLYIPRTSPRANAHKFDWLGAIWLSAVLIGMAWLLTQSRKQPQGFLITGGVIILVLAVGFIFYELRNADPVLQPRLFRHRSFAAACATVATSNLAMYTTLLALPILLADHAGWDATHIGLVLMVMSAAAVIFAPVGGKLADRYGRRWPTVGGLALALVGMTALTLAVPNLLMPVMLGGLALAGIGLGLSGSGMQTAAVESVALQETGVASGVYSTSRYLGSIVGSSVLAALVATSGDTAHGFQTLFWIIVAASAAAVITALGLHDRPSI